MPRDRRRRRHRRGRARRGRAATRARLRGRAAVRLGALGRERDRRPRGRGGDARGARRGRPRPLPLLGRLAREPRARPACGARRRGLRRQVRRPSGCRTGVPLVVPEVNGERALEHDGIVANPNCCAIPLTLVLKPLHDAAGLRAVRVATYQSASGKGAQRLQQLLDEPQAEHDLSTDWDFDGEEFDEEVKLREETRKILELPELPVSATCVRVPVPVGHAESVWLETEEPLDPSRARELLAAAPAVRVEDFPTPRPGGGRRRGARRPHPSRSGRRERPRALHRLRQPAQGRRAERDPDRRARALAAAGCGRLDRTPVEPSSRAPKIPIPAETCGRHDSTTPFSRTSPARTWAPCCCARAWSRTRSSTRRSSRSSRASSSARRSCGCASASRTTSPACSPSRRRRVHRHRHHLRRPSRGRLLPWRAGQALRAIPSACIPTARLGRRRRPDRRDSCCRRSSSRWGPPIRLLVTTPTALRAAWADGVPAR